MLHAVVCCVFFGFGFLTEGVDFWRTKYRLCADQPKDGEKTGQGQSHHPNQCRCQDPSFIPKSNDDIMEKSVSFPDEGYRD